AAATSRRVARHRPFGARLLRPALLRARPGGPVVARLGLRTRFGSPQVLAVVAERGGWLGVLSEHRPNGRLGWIPRRAARIVTEPYALRVDLSRRRLTVLRGGRVVRRVRVAVGAPGTATPTGRFAVTDLLRTGRADSPYGCCILALSGRQPDLPQGWPGGDRLAIHGTGDEASVGSAASNGCLRARRGDARWLLGHVTLGAPVTIRA
ncbi:MAG: L,D-transpeptidase, partial [Actinomycetota bacterium]|nr:L,D-transpeptidase [Actinomycetota bacterium]